MHMLSLSVSEHRFCSVHTPLPLYAREVPITIPYRDKHRLHHASVLFLPSPSSGYIVARRRTWRLFPDPGTKREPYPLAGVVGLSCLSLLHLETALHLRYTLLRSPSALLYDVRHNFILLHTILCSAYLIICGCLCLPSSGCVCSPKINPMIRIQSRRLSSSKSESVAYTAEQNNKINVR